MNIAFFAPLKSPNHPVPSGDRLMARLLIAALRKGGHQVILISELRNYGRYPEANKYTETEELAHREISRISGLWTAGTPPDLMFCYHPYYKAPDLLGPVLAVQFQIPYVTVETSYSSRRNTGYWSRTQEHVLAGIKQAAVNICLTIRDRDGILTAAPDARTVMLYPFIDPEPFVQSTPRIESDPYRLITVAMMRSGDKLDSYSLLARALAHLPSNLPWTLSIVGDGDMRAEVAAMFAGFGADRIIWHGKAATADVAAMMSKSALYVWPGIGEAYGLTYLEAQASGLAVVAMKTAGVPEAVEDEVTGVLTPPDDPMKFAEAIARLLTDAAERKRMGTMARKRILAQRTLNHAAIALDGILAKWGKRN